MKGKGTLTDLDRLKAEHREEFKAKAPKVKRIDEQCFKLRCPTAVNPARLKHSGGSLRLARGTCTNKRCIREAMEEYKRMLKMTRAWRRDKGRPALAKIWWGIMKQQRDKLRGKLK